MVARPLRPLLSITVALSIAAPLPSAYAQSPAAAPPAAGEPKPSDVDLDGIADSVDQCPQTYGAPPTGCPPTMTPTKPTPPPDRDGDWIPDADDQCPDVAGDDSSGCPPAEPVSTTPDETTTPPDSPDPTPDPELDADEEYIRVVETLPDDFDINYRYVLPTKRDRPHGGVSRGRGDPVKAMKGLKVSGSLLTLFGSVGVVSTLTAALIMTNSGEDELEEMKQDELDDPFLPVDDEARTDAIRKGEVGNDLLRIGVPVTGAATVVGISFLLGARSLKKKIYGTTRSDRGGGRGLDLSSKQRRNLTVYGALLLAYGAAGLIGGAVLATRDDEKKAKNGRILLGFSGAMAAVGVAMFIPVLVDKSRTAHIQTGPVFVRGGGGLGVQGRF